MLSEIIRRLTGRTYVVSSADLLYLFQKAGAPALRGFFWKALRLRRWQSFMLGANVKLISSHQLKLGKGVSIGSGAYLDCATIRGIVLHDQVTLREGVWIQGRSGLNPPGEGLSVGARTYIGPKAVFGIGGMISIGEDVQAGAGLNILAESHSPDLEGSFVSGAVSRKGISIGDRCWIGSNVVIVDGVVVGDDCVIGAGSVVTKSLPNRSKAYGVPARVQA